MQGVVYLFEGAWIEGPVRDFLMFKAAVKAVKG